MNLSKKILKAINEGVYNALVFDKDELEPSEEFNMQLGSSKNDIDISRKDLEKKHYSQKLQDMLPIPNTIKKDFIKLAQEWHKEYGATYNPHLDGNEFHHFIMICIEEKGIRVNLNWIDTSDITNMSKTFYYVNFIGNISEWNVSNVTNMHGMFSHSSFDGNLSKWDVSNVQDMGFMFDGGLFNKSISNLNVSHVENMGGMFQNSMFNRDISRWDVSNVKNIAWMFYNAEDFNQDISNWDIHNIDAEGRRYAFNGSGLKEIYKPQM